MRLSTQRLELCLAFGRRDRVSSHENAARVSLGIRIFVLVVFVNRHVIARKTTIAFKAHARVTSVRVNESGANRAEDVLALAFRVGLAQPRDLRVAQSRKIVDVSVGPKEHGPHVWQKDRRVRDV